MPLREMKWRLSRGLNFETPGCKVANGLNPRTRLATSPENSETSLGWECRSEAWEHWEGE